MSTLSSARAVGPGGLALYIGVVQFFFATTWTLYVIYLPALAAAAGIGREWVPWILVADQVVFAAADVATGFWIDRVRAGLARFGAWILAVSGISCAAFLALPFAGASPGVLLGAIVVWGVSSSALRSPPWALLARHAATPSIPWLSTLVLTGSTVAAALAPYLGVALKGVDPRVPFVVSTVTLLAAVGGLVLAERRMPAAAPAPAAAAPLELRRVALFFAALLLMAAGFQAHFALNSPHQYLRFAAPERLSYLMPVFWIGFNLMMFPASGIVKRAGPLSVLAGAAVAGALGMLGSVLAPDLGKLALAQFLAGGCWGAASVAAYSAAIGFGRTGREGRLLGTFFAVLALAAFARIAAYASDVVTLPEIRAALPWLPQATWLAAAALLVLAGQRR